MAQLMPLQLTVSCFSKIQIGFTFLVLAHPGSPGQRAVKQVLNRCVREYKKDILQHTHTHTFNSRLSGTTLVNRYHKGKTNLDFTGARDSEWLWHQLGHMQVCTLLQTDNHAN